ncbi:MAG: TrkH family potassium uptake protein, partial [Clostridia bacterium]|nr:TrkH family potassium uptake protein [Clostridia bacterium]
VFVMAFVSISDRSIHIMRAEMPGPIVGKLVPRAKDTSKVLYIMYIVLTLVLIVFLWCGDMDLFDSIVYALGTAGTGGFGIKADSVGGYSAYSQWVIGIFMIIFGVNFNLYYLAVIRRFKAAIRSEELWTYLGIVLGFSALIAVNINHMFSSVTDSIRHAFFQVASLISTSGFATTDFNLWPDFSKALLLIVLFTGACAGSTAGGLKLSRVVLLFKMISKEIKRLIYPRSVSNVKFEGKDLDDNTQRSVTTYFAVYMICFFIFFVIVSLEPFGFETNFTATATCFNNVGPGFGMVGPAGSFAAYSDFSKLVLSLAMLMGRLEIFPLLIALIPSTWRKR